MITKLLLLALFSWLSMRKAQDLLTRWRLQRAGEPDLKLVVDDRSRWNVLVIGLFSFLRFVIMAATVLLVLLWVTLILTQ